VLLGKNLTVLHWLNSAVVMILVNLLVDGGVNLLMDVGLDDLMLNSGCNSFVDGGVMVTRLAHEVSDRCLRLVHYDEVVVVFVIEVVGIG
jgi:hypothetical protein